MKSDLCVVIKGAGEMATGVAWRLHMARLKVVLTDIPKPLAVRRAVSFCEAVYDGSKEVEGVWADFIKSPEEVASIHQKGRIPVLVDPDLKLLAAVKPDAVVEATLNKTGTGLSADMAPLVIAMGPGFEAPKHAHYVLETNRGHNLGRIYDKGMAAADTGVPGTIAGKNWQRVLRAPRDGVFQAQVTLGAEVSQGQVLGEVEGEKVFSPLDGVVRGLIRPGIEVTKDLKIGDVDPRGDIEYLHTISEKARALGGSVLEVIMRVYNK